MFGFPRGRSEFYGRPHHRCGSNSNSLLPIIHRPPRGTAASPLAMLREAKVGLDTVPPLTTFSQNSGVIALTRNASRSSGYMCAFILFLMGIIGKFGAIFCAAPSSVIGGFTTFLFGAVTTSGVRVLAYCKWTRRDRFIATVGIALGMASLCVPEWFSYFFTYTGSNGGLVSPFSTL